MGNCLGQVLQRKGDDGVALNWYRKLVEGCSAAKGNAVGRALYEPFKPLGHATLNRKDDRRIIFETTPVRYATVPAKEHLLYKKLHQTTNKYDTRLNDLDFEPDETRKKTSGFQIVTELVHREGKPKDELFPPLKFDDDEEVSHALYGDNSHEILVIHEPSNIVISRRVLQCLIPGGWLNDEVINLYLELLKERERREHKKFLKCHFFNTFFYKKLTSGNNGYDFKAVRRWTTKNKLGYTLIECEKVFVPVHKHAHWCLVVINIKDKTLQYLDSLGGMDTHVLNVLAMYLMDETRDKCDTQIDSISWNKEPVNDLPLQMNWYDCGMFMIKYADFYSRGLKLCFSQEHMEYFRKKTAIEILKLRAE